MTPAASSKAVSSPVRPSGVAGTLDQFWPILDQFVDQRRQWMIDLRRKIHASPEGSGQEIKTTALVAGLLSEAGLQPRVMQDGLGVVVDIDLGGPKDSFVAVRAELDCVHVDDEKTVAYASKNPGLCHACGHDAHSTIALAATLAVHENREWLGKLGLRHNFRAVFQPAEEAADGALSMIRQGAVKGVKAIFAVHVEPFLDAGVIGLRKGPLTSACKCFQITIKGRSGHSARPFQTIDPIPAAVSLTDLFYQLCPRSMDSRYPLSLTVASINAGSSFNAIPDEAILKGTLRTARLEDLEAVQQKMAAIIKGVATATGCEITMEVPTYAPPTNNDGALIDVMAEATVGAKCTAHWIDVPSLGAEDFAFFQEVVPGAIVRLGAGLPQKDQRRALHSSMFDIDEAALGIGARVLARSALMAARTA